MKRIVKTLLILLPLQFTSMVQASSIQPHEEIKQTVIKFLTSKSRHFASTPEIQVQPLDRRLKLAKCSSPLKIFMLPGSRSIGRVSVGVRCEEGLHPWTIYTSANIKIFAEVVVLRESLPRNSEISAADLTLKKVEVSGLRSGYLTSPAEAIGKKLRRNLQKNRPLNQRFLVIPKLVKKGKQVIILAQSSSLSIRMAGKALSNGSKGELIRIQNSKSGKIIQAKVIAEGIVQIPL